MSHEPLSQCILRIVEGADRKPVTTLNEIIANTGGRGIYLINILLCLPFLTPIPLPGISSIFGLVMLMMAVRQAMAQPISLPKFLGERPIQIEQHRKIVKASLKLIRFIEKTARPRGKEWLDLRAARLGNSIVLIVLSMLLVIPFPPFVLLTNSLPGLAMIIISASVMEENGLMIWAGYAIALLATAYIIGIFLAIFGGVNFFADYFA